MARIVLATREVWPFLPGGGIGRYVWTLAGQLAAEHDVTVVTSSRHRPTRDRLPPGVALVAVDEPESVTPPHVAWADEWSARLHAAVAALAPDLVEFQDYLGEGFATVQARRAGDPALRDTTVVVRLQGSAEMYSALNHAPVGPDDGLVWAMERFALRHADAVLYPGGDVLDRAGAFYGELPPAVRLPSPLVPDPVAAVEPPRDGPLRILFLNRCMPLKGAAELILAVRSRPDRDLRLTLVGGDTDLAPGGGSMRAHLARLAAGDGRIGFVDRVGHEAVDALIGAHHVVAVPSRWETFSYVVREALAAHRPVLATPVGAIPEVVVPGRSGWLAASTAAADLAATLDEIDLEAALALIDAGVAGALEDERRAARELPAAYARLAARPTWSAPVSLPDVRVLLSVTDLDVWDEAARTALDGTRSALAAQTDVAVRVTEARAVTDRVAAYRDALAAAEASAPGPGAGEHYVALVPGTCRPVPHALARLVAALEAEPAFAYATARAGGTDLAYAAPLGGRVAAGSGVDAGASIAVVRRDALRARLATAAHERDLWDGLDGVVSQDVLVDGWPLRPQRDVAPTRGGAPDPAAAAAALGAIWHSAAAVDVPEEIPVDDQLREFVAALAGDRAVEWVAADDVAGHLARPAAADGPAAPVLAVAGLPGTDAVALLAAAARERPVAVVVANRLRRPSEPGAAHLDAARAALAALPDARWLSQHRAEGTVLLGDGDADALVGAVRGAASAEPEYAEQWLVGAGFGAADVERARAALALTAVPAATRELADLRRANAELQRHNRDLASGLLGRHDAAAATAVAKLDERTREAETRAWILEQEKLAAEARATQLERWHDAGRYHAVDAAVRAARRVPGVGAAGRGVRRLVRAVRPRR